MPCPPSTLHSLSLDDLRLLRGHLADEEALVSHWCRLVQARPETFAADSVSSATILRDILKATRRWRVLGLDPDESERDVRRALEGRPDSATASVIARDLSAARVALQRQLKEVTAELVSRYRTNPALALTALETRRVNA